MNNWDCFEGKVILLTGHTGFKGTWLTHLLGSLGAKVVGLSLPIGPENSFFTISNAESKTDSSFYHDISDLQKTEITLRNVDPDYIFHFAAQPLISKSYQDPLRTIQVNVIGTLNLLTLALKSPNLKGVTIAATDKVYANRAQCDPFIESDILGGDDPYSASKAATEILIKSISKSCNPFLIPVTTIRAGNVIGFGDNAENRLVPDIWRSIETGNTIKIRNKDGIRPWLFITDSLSAYLGAARAHLVSDYDSVSTEFNVGTIDQVTVSDIIEIFSLVLGRPIATEEVISPFRENPQLLLNPGLIKQRLGWYPKFSTKQAVMQTALSYHSLLSGSKVADIVLSTIQRDFTK